MSNVASNWARPLPLPPTLKAVLLNLADKANKLTGKCWPCLKTIARETGFCVRTVRFALRALEAMGLIRTMHQVGRRSFYWVLFGVVVQPEPVQLDLGLVQEMPDSPVQDSAPPRNPEPDKESLKDQPSEEPRESAQARAPANPPPVSKSTLPTGWQPSPLDVAFALSLGLVPGSIADAFADHYRSTGAVRADWSAAWRNWCRREPQFSSRKRRDRGIVRNADGVSEAAAELLAGIDAYEARISTLGIAA